MSTGGKRKCPRCAAVVESGAVFCSACGARVERGGASSKKAPPTRVMKAILALLGALVLTMAVLVVLLLEGKGQETNATADPYAAASMPEMAEEPDALPEGEQAPIIGTWVAARLQNNTNQSKEIVLEAVIDEERTVIRFSEGGEAVVLALNEAAGRPVLTEEAWYGEGQDFFIDAGRVTIEGETYFGRRRYFFRDEELFNVYTLDGIEVTDFIVFAPAGAEDIARLEEELERDGI